MRAPWQFLEPRAAFGGDGGGSGSAGPGDSVGGAAGDEYRAMLERQAAQPKPPTAPAGPTPQQLEQERIAAAMAALTQAFAGYDPSMLWYDAYLAYANPMLSDEYSRARQQLEYALSRSAQTGTELGNQRLAELDARYQQGQQQVQGQAQIYKQQGQQALVGLQGDLQQKIQQDKTVTADKVPGLVTTAKSGLQQPTFSPLADLFTEISAGIPMGQYDPRKRGSAGVFVPAGGSTPAPVVNTAGSQSIVG